MGNFGIRIFDQPSPDQATRHFEEEKPKQDSIKDFPKTDIYLTDIAVIVLVELPGAIKEEVHLTVSGTRLTIKGVVRLPIIQGVTVQSSDTMVNLKEL